MEVQDNVNLVCLWLSLRNSLQNEEVPAEFKRHCGVIRSSGFDAAAVDREGPDFIVLEFDYPSRQDLARAAGFRQDHPGVPMIVVTVQHSESLAIWFFRSKFSNYLVQPLASMDVANCIAEMQEIRAFRAEQPQRAPARARMSIPMEAGSGARSEPQFRAALALVERNYHAPIRVTDAAERCGIPTFRFGRAFKEQFGMDFREYLLRYRIREACRLLSNPNASVTEVSYSVGFNEPSYFTRMFKKLVGRVPSDVLGEETDFRITIR